MKERVRHILTRPDTTSAQVLDAFGGLGMYEVMQVEVGNRSEMYKLMDRIEEAYPAVRPVVELFKSDGVRYCYIMPVPRYAPGKRSQIK